MTSMLMLEDFPVNHELIKIIMSQQNSLREDFSLNDNELDEEFSSHNSSF